MPGPSSSRRAVVQPQDEGNDVPPPPPYRSPPNLDGENSDDSGDFEITAVNEAPPKSTSPSPSPPPTKGKGKKRARETSKAGPATKKVKSPPPAGAPRRSTRHSQPAGGQGQSPNPDFSQMNFPPVRRPPRLIPRDRDRPSSASDSLRDPGPSRARRPGPSRLTPFSGSPTDDDNDDQPEEDQEEEEEEEEEGEAAGGGEGPPRLDEVAFPNPQPPGTPVTASIFHPVDQLRALSMAQNGKSLFVTGPAGSGKTYTLVMIKRVLVDKYKQKTKTKTNTVNVATVAATHNAALCCDGETYHSFFGFAPNDIDLDTAYERSGRQRAKITALQALLIDEVSQLSKKTFQLLSDLLAKVKRNNLPFGGVQVICFGDFLQLPPLPDAIKGPVEYAFESDAWVKAIGDRMVRLRQDVVRAAGPQGPQQKAFRVALEHVRTGIVSEETVRFFEGLTRPLPRSPVPTQLFARKKDADAANEVKLHQLKGRTSTFIAHDSMSGFEDFEFARYLDTTNAPKDLTLKQFSQVVFLKGDPRGEFIRPGTHGVVLGLADVKMWSKAEKKAAGTQPVTHTVSVGTGVRDKDVMWPVVKCVTANNRTVLARVMKAEWRLEVDKDRFMERLQVPLRLCWATTIHSVQGRTLNAVQADLRKAFECGQAYVALSRVADPDRLQIVNFDPSQIRGHADHRVLKFYGLDEDVY
ncbi:hypothetical protein A4X13_0g8547 [Tilletia indica]|uniref:ATP-dependent DNA helicase n=1 Tax=Tilletia indica TaxID=43049 RepID=A0A177T1P4_9BASI|nr:hypothetical protein A4X13_0g8547 [Tilletia indica]